MPILVHPDPEFWQGDIFAQVPWSAIKNHFFVRSDGTTERYIAVPQHEIPRKGRIITTGGIDLAMLLSHECVVDKNDNAPLAFARVLPIRTQNSSPGQEAIRNGRNYQTFHLPAVDGIIEESYVDFRLITCIERRVLNTLNRLGSLTEEGRNSLRMQLILYWTRLEPKQIQLPLTE